jgi:hypothetical protein
VDNAVIKRHISSAKTKDGRTRKQIYVLIKHVSKPEEQEIVKRGYVLHLSYKRKRGGGEVRKEIEKISNRKKHPASALLHDSSFPNTFS